MKKAEPQKADAHHQSAATQAGGLGVASPQGEKIAQLEALIEGSSQMTRSGALAAQIHAGPVTGAQRKIISKAPAQRQPAPAANTSHISLPENLDTGIESLSDIAMDHADASYDSSMMGSSATDGAISSSSVVQGKSSQAGTVIQREETVNPEKGSIAKLKEQREAGKAGIITGSYSEYDITKLLSATDVGGKLQQLLLKDFQANWFLAKDCLVFGWWPDNKPPPWYKSDPGLGIRLMVALTDLRQKVYAEVKADVKKMEKFTGDQMMFFDPDGSNTPTSDVDVPTGGSNSEAGVAAFNELFRKKMGVAIDSGTVFDLNVYAKDFIFSGGDKWENKEGGDADKMAKEAERFVPGAEHSEQLTADMQEARDNKQDIWALVHVARYTENYAAWENFAVNALLQIPDADGPKRTAERKRLAEAWVLSEGLKHERKMAEQALKAEVDKAIEQLGKVDAHAGEEILHMRASNKLYEVKMQGVKALRDRIAELGQQNTPEASKARLALIAELPSRISEAQYFGNEVYGSGGATVHAVKMQTLDKKNAERKDKGLPPVKLQLSAPQWFQAFTDNLGDVLKDFLHFGKLPKWYATFRMGKYVNRMVGTVPEVVQEPKLSEIQGKTPHKKLEELGKQHVEAKKTHGKSDPKKIAEEPYFKTVDPPVVFRDHALNLGSEVRATQVNARPEPEQAKAEAMPKNQDAPQQAVPGPEPAAEAASQAPLAAAVEKAADKAQAVESRKPS